MTIVHKQISPVAATGVEREQWDTCRLMQHLELIGPDKNIAAKPVGLITTASKDRRERKAEAQHKQYTEAPNGKRIRPIPGHSHYYATEDGEIYSGRQGKLRHMKTYNSGKHVNLQSSYGMICKSVERLTELAWE